MTSPESESTPLRQLLIVESGGALFALPTDDVREIVPEGLVTRLPGAPNYVPGILNVRGTLITLVDLGQRVVGVSPPRGDRSVVIVNVGTRLLGLRVDDVHESHGFAPHELLPPGGERSGGIVRGMGHFGSRVVLEVDVQELAGQTLA